ncbi:MAG: hypothetical protein QXV87_01120 [Candidatus Bathyarchaeia archaeon]
MRVFEILSKMGKVVSLDEARWRHVLEHPEMQNQLDKVKETVENPDEVRESSRMSSTWLFYKFYIKSPVTKKYLLVVVKVLDGEGFIVTAFFTNKVKKGGLIWKKKD